jgi:hypothetical protein
VPGAAAGATQSVRFSDSSGARRAETVLSAATGVTLYVVEVATPADYADENGDLVTAVINSLQITGR